MLKNQKPTKQQEKKIEKQANSNKDLLEIADEMKGVAGSFTDREKIKAVLNIISNKDVENNIKALKEIATKDIEKDKNNSFFNQAGDIVDNIVKDESYVKIKNELTLYTKIQEIKNPVMENYPDAKKAKYDDNFNTKLNEETGKNISNIIKSELDKDFYQSLPKIKSLLELCGDDLKQDIKKLVYDKITKNYNHKEDKEEKGKKLLKSVLDKEWNTKNLFTKETTYDNDAIEEILKEPQNYEVEIYHDFTIKKAKTIDELAKKFPSCGLKSEMIPKMISKMHDIYKKDKDKSE